MRTKTRVTEGTCKRKHIVRLHEGEDMCGARSKEQQYNIHTATVHVVSSKS